MPFPDFLIPKSFRLRGKLWRVYIEPDRPKWMERKGYRTLGSDNLLGLTLMNHREIHLAYDLRSDPANMHVVFIHELLHACFPNRVVGDATEEKIVFELSLPLYEALRQLGWKQPKRRKR